MSDITGKDNEFAFVTYLNGRKINELNPMFKSLIDTLFPWEYETSKINSWLNKNPEKSDIFVKINGKVKGISIKKGYKNSVHVERITDFIHFLIENKVDRDIVIKYLQYHYADGSTNGKGAKRLSTKEYKEYHQRDIDKINKVFNNENLLTKAIDRFVLKGNNSPSKIDALVYGEVDSFLFLTRKDIINIIISKRKEYSTGVHFGCLSVQPKNRCLNYNKKYEKDRYCVQLKWFNLNDSIIEYMNKRVMMQSKMPNWRQSNYFIHAI